MCRCSLYNDNIKLDIHNQIHADKYFINETKRWQVLETLWKENFDKFINPATVWETFAEDYYGEYFGDIVVNKKKLYKEDIHHRYWGINLLNTLVYYTKLGYAKAHFCDSV